MSSMLKATMMSVLLVFTAACGADNAAKGTAAAEVKVENAYIRAVPPGQPNSAAFLTLVNSSAKAHSVKSATSPVAATVELHTHTNNNGVMEMRQVPQIDIPANGKTELKPGGLHIMLIGLKQPLKAGEKANVSLQFEDGSNTTVSAAIQEVSPPAGMGMH
jgi:hypothetical protein